MSKTQELKERIYKHCPELKGNIPKDLPLPVRYDGMMYYWGKDGEMVADFDSGVNDGAGFRIRGWGRIQDEKSQDECAKYIEQAINSYSQIQLQHILRAMTVNVDISNAIAGSGEYENVISIDAGGDIYFYYNLAKSFDQNISDNPELVDFLLEVIK